ncbi:MAG: CBS domain-containing protein [Actinomycetota bacterium]|nr:CBS domain-containing protein [Actinomycetota bacterium]
MDAIVSHTNMDFDSLAAMVAAQKIYPDAKILLPKTSSANVRRFLTLHSDMIDHIELEEIEGETVGRIILVDTRAMDRIGEAARLFKEGKSDLIIYDHHPKSDDDVDFGDDRSKEAGSTTTILVSLIKDMGIPITPFEATLFALGIHEDTGSLTHPTSTPKDAMAIAHLMEEGADPGVINHFLKSALTDEQHDLLTKLLGLAKKQTFLGLGLIIIKVTIDEYIEDASVVVRKIAELEDADLIFLMMGVGEKNYVIARSRLDEIDVGRVMQRLGGGGHANVGSAVVKDMGAKEIEEIILSEVSSQAKGALTAGDIMSKPVVTIGLERSIKEAGALMARYGFDGLPVVDGESYAGMILRRDVDKAVHHGLSHAPVKGFLSSFRGSVDPKTLASEVERMMTRSTGKIPVLDKGQIVGIITRSNIISSLRSGRFSALEGDELDGRMSRERIIESIAGILSESTILLIKEIGKMADSNGHGCYLVGGFVRDLFLKRENLDIDIVVEGDALSFSEAVAKKLGGRVKLHKKFRTAIFITKAGQRIDFASARFEHYDYPAALPRVEPSSIIYDLSRRDFTINSMAIKINEKDFGELLDPFGGIHDLKEGRLKVLHALSFIEDPTRIFRAARFERRFDLRMDEAAELLAKKAAELGVIERLSSARLTYELIQVLSEPDPYILIARLFELKALKAIHPRIKVGSGPRGLFSRIQRSLEILKTAMDPKAKRWLPYMMTLLYGLTQEEIDHFLLKMDFSRADKESISRAILSGQDIIKELSAKSIKDSEIYLTLERFGIEALIFLHALSENRQAKERILRFQMELKSVKPNLSGKDLIELGFEESPLYNLVLRRLLLLRLDSKLLGRKSEIEFAKKFFESEGV